MLNVKLRAGAERHRPFFIGHRPYRPDCYSKALPPKVASTGCTSAMSELAAFGLHSTCLASVGRAFFHCHLDRSGEISRQARDDRGGVRGYFDRLNTSKTEKNAV